MMGRVNNILIVLAALLVAVGCTKKRDDRLAQGAGVLLQTYSELDGKSFVLQTGAVISEDTATASEELEVEGDVKGIRSLPLVAYTTDAELLGQDIPFRGRPNHRYEIRYRIKDRYLHVEKVAPARDIPTSEMTYAEETGDGRYSVPLVGYPVSYSHLENQRNSDNEATHIVIEVADPVPTPQSRVRVNYLQRQVFTAIEKIDVYPAEYFLGTENETKEWYFSETVVATSEEASATTLIGATSSGFDSSFNPASKIRFMKEKDQLRGVNINIDERLNEIIKDERLNYKSVISIPVEWKSYRLALDGSGNDSLKEEDRSEIKWDQREFMAIKFEDTRTVIASLETYLVNLTGGKKLVDLRFASDYFSYALLDIDSGQITRYSFLRAPKAKQANETLKPGDYVPRSYPWRTRKDFGYFTSSWNQIYNYELYKQEDLERHTYLNRFHPNKDIVFYITNNSPPENPSNPLLTRVAQRAVDYWDRAFKLAGTNMNVRLDTSKRVDLADIRYNAINYIDGVSGGGGLLGFGPSLSDPRTGEIIMATSNIHVANFRSTIVSQIRQYLRQELGFYDAALNNRPDLVMGEFAQTTDVGVTSPLNYQFTRTATGEIKDLEFPVTDYLSRDGYKMVSLNNFSPDSAYSKLVTYIDKGPAPQSAFELSQRYQSIAKQNPEVLRFAMHADQEGFEVIMSDSIEEKCPELKSYVSEVLADMKDFSTEAELTAMESCVNVFLEEKVLATLVHEMGHNFGLAHNFIGSIDKKNFWSVEELKSYFNLEVTSENLPHSSSSMDYVPGEFDRLVTPGKYDIAAIHFGYVDDKEKNPIQIDLNGKPLYCDDWDADQGENPLCMRHDYGTTPQEIAQNYLRVINQNMAVHRYRFDRANVPLTLVRVGNSYIIIPSAAWSNINYMTRLKGLYDKWRFILKDYVGTKAEYLQGLYDPWDPRTVSNYRSNVLAKMAADPAFKDDFAQYYPVRNATYGLLKDIALLPDSMCMYEDADKDIQWISMSTIRDEVKSYRGRDTRVMSCNDPVVSELIADVYDGKYISQVGQPTQNFQFSLDVGDIRFDDIDVIGVFAERLFAGILLSNRSSGTLAHLDAGMQPSMLDEPDLRWDYSEALRKRMILGADIGERYLGPDSAGVLMAENYANDGSLINGLYNGLVSSANVPGSSSESFLRMAPMLATQFRSRNDVTEDYVDSVVVNGLIIAAREENTFTRYLMAEYRSTAFRAANIDEIVDQAPKIRAAVNSIVNSIPVSNADKTDGGIKTVAEFRVFGKALLDAIQANGENSVVAKLIQSMFQLELTLYTGAILGFEEQVQVLTADVQALQALLDSGTDTDGSALTAEREAAIKTEITQKSGAVAQFSQILAIPAYADFAAAVNQVAGGSLPPVQKLMREPIARRFEELTKKGSAQELDAKRTMLLNAIMAYVQ